MKRYYDSQQYNSNLPNKKPYLSNVNKSGNNISSSGSCYSNLSTGHNSSYNNNKQTQSQISISTLSPLSTGSSIGNSSSCSPLSNSPASSNYYSQNDYLSKRSPYVHQSQPSPTSTTGLVMAAAAVPHPSYYLQRTVYAPPPPPPRVQWHGPPLSTPGVVGRRWPLPVMPQSSYVPRPAQNINGTVGNNIGNPIGTGQSRKKQKKKSIPQNIPTRVIKIEDAEAALKCENEYTMSTKQLVIRFPDPPIDRDIVLNFNPAIKKVHFQHPSIPRYCFIQLDEDADTNKTIEELRQIKFGLGNLKVELKHELNERRDRPEDIDPYVLFVGNIGQNTPAETIKTLFHPGRVDIGPSQKVKNSRYALVKFTSAQDAIEVFKKTRGMVVGNHSLNVRFRRINGSVGLPGDKPKKSQPTTENVTESNNKNTTANSINNNSSVTSATINDNNNANDCNSILNNKTSENSVSENISELNTNLTVKKEEQEDYNYYEHFEPADDIDIKMKNEYYNNEENYYIEQPEMDFDELESSSNSNYFFDCDNNSVNNSYNSPNDNHSGGLNANEFAEQLNDLSSLPSTTRSSSNDLGSSVKQIHLPSRPSTTNNNIKSSSIGDIDKVRIKLELESDGYEAEARLNNEANEFVQELNKIENENVVSTNSNNENNLVVRIPRDKIQINKLPKINENDPSGGDGYDDDEFIKALNDAVNS